MWTALAQITSDDGGLFTWIGWIVVTALCFGGVIALKLFQRSHVEHGLEVKPTSGVMPEQCERDNDHG
jgi:hypothetical protein